MAVTSPCCQPRIRNGHAYHQPWCHNATIGAPPYDRWWHRFLYGGKKR